MKINKLLEGNSFISCKSLKGKMINGDNIHINAEGGMIDIEAVYGESTNLYSTSHINVDLCRGDITVYINNNNYILTLYFMIISDYPCSDGYMYI